MKAVVCQNTELSVMERAEPVPGTGQVLLKVLRCGICGSDLHARRHCDHLLPLMEKSGYRGFMTSKDQVVFGHEFCGEILAYGPRCNRKVRLGSRVCALPLLRREGAIEAIGLSPHAPGAYAERVAV